MGRVDVDAMLEEIDADLFWEWVLYDSVRPIGEDAADERTASLGMISLAKGGVKRPEKSDVLPWMKAAKPASRQQTPEQIKAVLGMAKRAMMKRGKHGKK